MLPAKGMSMQYHPCSCLQSDAGKPRKMDAFQADMIMQIPGPVTKISDLLRSKTSTEHMMIVPRCSFTR